MCVTTGNFELDEFGNVILDKDGNAIPMGMNTRKQLSADAYDAARLAVFNGNLNRYQSGQSMMSSEQANSLFKITFINELKKKMTGVAVSTGSCLGSVKKGRPIFNFFGLCIESTCKYN